MTRYELACDKRVTLAAIISESAMIVACVLLADAALEHFSIQTMMASHVSLQAAIIVVIAIQYVIATIEIVASYRDDNRGATIPIAFVPGGIILRFVLMVVAIGAVVALKLLVYFLSVLTAFATQILRIDKWCSTAKWADSSNPSNMASIASIIGSISIKFGLIPAYSRRCSMAA